MRTFVTLFALLFVGLVARADVEIKAEADGPQPIGSPLVLQITVINHGPEELTYFTPAGPDFKIETRESGDEQWRDAVVFNSGQGGISNFMQKVKPSESVVWPVAIEVPIHADSVDVRIACPTWKTVPAAEFDFQFSNDTSAFTERRSQMIKAAMPGGSYFWSRFASKYADANVDDAFVKLAAIDNELIVQSVANVLSSRREKLTPSAGDVLGPLAAEWLVRDFDTGATLLEAAVNSQSERAREIAFKYIASTADGHRQAKICEMLVRSNRDLAWLGRVHDALQNLRPASKNANVVHDLDAAKAYLDERIRNLLPQEKEQ